jgi:hypothetical protein
MPTRKLHLVPHSLDEAILLAIDRYAVMEAVSVHGTRRAVREMFSAPTVLDHELEEMIVDAALRQRRAIAFDRKS